MDFLLKWKTPPSIIFLYFFHIFLNRRINIIYIVLLEFSGVCYFFFSNLLNVHALDFKHMLTFIFCSKPIFLNQVPQSKIFTNLFSKIFNIPFWIFKFALVSKGIYYFIYSIQIYFWKKLPNKLLMALLEVLFKTVKHEFFLKFWFEQGDNYSCVNMSWFYI